MSEPKEIYLGPACQEQGRSDGREWCQDDVWDACECGHESVRYVLGEDFDRVTAERDALQALLTAADERADVLEGLAADVVEGLWGVELPGAGNARLRKMHAALKPAEGGAVDHTSE